MAVVQSALFEQVTLPDIKPKLKRMAHHTCCVCGGREGKLYRCDGCLKLAHDACGGEDEDWFCNNCWNKHDES